MQLLAPDIGTEYIIFLTTAERVIIVATSVYIVFYVGIPRNVIVSNRYYEFKGATSCRMIDTLTLKSAVAVLRPRSSNKIFTYRYMQIIMYYNF